MWEGMERTRQHGFGPEVKRRILLGTYALSSGYYDAYYRKAQQVRTLIRHEFEEAFTRYDVLLTAHIADAAIRGLARGRTTLSKCTWRTSARSR